MSANEQEEVDKGNPSEFTCPACGGTLFETELDSVLQFRCRVGHGYSSESLLAGQQEHLESALYASVVALEERADLSRRMARRMEQGGWKERAERYWRDAEMTEQQASIVRDAIGQLKSAAERDE